MDNCVCKINNIESCYCSIIKQLGNIDNYTYYINPKKLNKGFLIKCFSHDFKKRLTGIIIKIIRGDSNNVLLFTIKDINNKIWNINPKKYYIYKKNSFSENLLMVANRNNLI